MSDKIKIPLDDYTRDLIRRNRVLEYDLKETLDDLLYVLGEIKEHGVMEELLNEFKDKYEI